MASISHAKNGRRTIQFVGADGKRHSIRLGKVSQRMAESVKLKVEHLAATTIAKRLQFAQQFFAVMQRRKLIEENPFAHVKHKAGDPTERQRFINRESVAKLLDAAPDWIWRTIIALARYGGLRCPSEVLSLKWGDVDWEKAQLRVESPKTGTRVVPIFPERIPCLEGVVNTTEEGHGYVVPKYRESALGPDGWVNCNVRTQFQRIVKRAGLEAWPRLFH